METSTPRRVAVVGASGVLGRYITESLATVGFSPIPFVWDLDRSPEKYAAAARYCDLTDTTSLAAAFEGLETPLAGVVIASGVVAFGSLGEIPSDIVEQLFAVNALGVQLVLDTAAHVVTPGGFMVNLTGVAAEHPLVGMSAYCASKAAASMAMRVARRELRRRQINILDARPGHIETGLVARALWGTPPRLPHGLDPTTVADRVVTAILAGEPDLPPEAFSTT
jgi:NAD(P)-dependent dehydrogenase (short-subunit alcohol dehydrogenase family)